MRKSSIFLTYITANLLVLGFLYIYTLIHESNAASLLNDLSDTVAKYEISDLCLFTEASYTRHLTQADRHTPFQDSPVGLEHFPSGSLLMPPAMLKNRHGRVD